MSWEDGVSCLLMRIQHGPTPPHPGTPDQKGSLSQLSLCASDCGRGCRGTGGSFLLAQPATDCPTPLGHLQAANARARDSAFPAFFSGLSQLFLFNTRAKAARPLIFPLPGFPAVLLAHLSQLGPGLAASPWNSDLALLKSRGHPSAPEAGLLPWHLPSPSQSLSCWRHLAQSAHPGVSYVASLCPSQSVLLCLLFFLACSHHDKLVKSHTEPQGVHSAAPC